MTDGTALDQLASLVTSFIDSCSLVYYRTMKASVDLLFVASQDRGGCTGLEVGAGRERCAEEGREVCKSTGMGY